MKTKTITYSYDPDARYFHVYVDGVVRGFFTADEADKRFNEALETGAEISLTTMTSDAIKRALIRQFHAALAKQGIMDYKSDIVGRYNVESTTELSKEQLRELVDEYTSYNRQVDNAKIRAMRSEILTVLNKLGIYVNNTDWTAVNAYLMDKRIAGKLLWQMDESELLKLRNKLHGIFTKSVSASAEITRKQQMN